jgi:hypothetical protein
MAGARKRSRASKVCYFSLSLSLSLEAAFQAVVPDLGKFLSSYFYFFKNKKYFEIYISLSDQMSLEMSPNLHILKLPQKKMVSVRV